MITVHGEFSRKDTGKDVIPHRRLETGQFTKRLRDGKIGGV
jgi:hypothetical protein